MRRRNWSAYILAAVLLAFAISTLAQVGDDAICEAASDFAANTMKARQENVPVTDMMAVVARPEHERFAEFMRTIVWAAYSKPRSYTEQGRMEAPDAFANQIFVSCSMSMQDR